MATSIFNRQRRRKFRAEKKAQKRRMRRTEGDWKFPDRPAYWNHPNMINGREGKSKR